MNTLRGNKINLSVELIYGTGFQQQYYIFYKNDSFMALRNNVYTSMKRHCKYIDRKP